MGLFHDLIALQGAHLYATKHSACQKVKVGSVISKSSEVISFGANVAIPNHCDRTSCNKILPHDGLPHCVSTLHSEVDAIINAATLLTGATIHVTRYPCENCARAIVAAGIKEVVYGRKQEISTDTQRIFQTANILVRHVPQFDEEDSYV